MQSCSLNKNSKSYCPFMHYNKVAPTMAVAHITGAGIAPDLMGYAFFKDVTGGTEVSVEVNGLPLYKPAENGGQPIGPHGFHIHKFGDCKICDPDKPFTSTDGHWNPTDQPHGNHSGDFPVLFSNNGYARMTFFTDKFKVADIIGKSVVIHESPDDYRTQPAGNSGKMIGCGVISPYYIA